MKKTHTLALLVVILLAAFFLRQHKLFGFPFFGDEVASGNIALDILDGKIAPFYQQAEGREALYSYTMALAFALLGDSEMANRWPSVAWSMAFVALMFVYGRILFKSDRAGLLSAGLTAALFWPTVFAHIGLRAVSMPVLMVPVVMGVLMGVHRGFVAVLVTVVAMSRGLVPVLMFMLVLGMATHPSTLLSSFKLTNF